MGAWLHRRQARRPGADEEPEGFGRWRSQAVGVGARLDWRLDEMRRLVQDFRYAARLLLRSPGFTLIAVAALALGIGANTAIFTVVDTLLLRPLPYANADRLAVVWEHNVPRDRKNNVVSPGNFIHWRELNQSFQELSAVSMTFRMTLTGAGDAVELPVQFISGSLFGLLGVRPAVGRDFTPQEDAPGVTAVAISDRLWRQRFGSDPTIVNKTITLNGRPNLVVGVMPPGFSILDKNVDVWSTVGFPPAARTPRGRWICVVGRLKDGVTMAQAQDDMVRVHAELTRRFPAFNTGWTANVVPLKQQLTGDVRPALLVMLGAVGVRAAHRVRECRQPRARARHRAAARARGPRRARRRARTVDPPDARGEPAALAVRRRRGTAARLVGGGRAADDRCRSAADRAAGTGRHRRHRAAVHGGRRTLQRGSLRRRTGADVGRRETDRYAERRRAIRVRRARSPRAQHVRRGRDRAGARAAGRRRAAAPELRRVAPGRSRLQSGADTHRQGVDPPIEVPRCPSTAGVLQSTVRATRRAARRGRRRAATASCR